MEVDLGAVGLGVERYKELGVPHAFAREEPPVGVIFLGGGRVGDGCRYVLHFLPETFRINPYTHIHLSIRTYVHAYVTHTHPSNNNNNNHNHNNHRQYIYNIENARTG